MAEVAAPIIAEQVGVRAACWIKHQLSYVFNFKSNEEKYNDQLSKLKLRIEKIKHDVDDATRTKMEVIEGEVEDWLQRATTIHDDNRQHILEETERAKKGCFFGLCPNVKARYQLSKKAEKESKAAADLLLQGEFTRVSYLPAAQGLRFEPIKGYEAFQSRACHLEAIMKALKDSNVNMIGVWGMGGVGKTTLVKKAVEQANVDRIFDVVVSSVVSTSINQDLRRIEGEDLRRIQGEIADALRFKFDAETISGRSNQLRERLQKESKILVILDNVLARLDLGELGIPFGDDHRGCKILMTSRYEHVLTEIGHHRWNIKVDALNDGEAWNLFEKMAGDVLKARDLRLLAIDIAKSCAGLPILITTVASALRDTDDSNAWKEALRQLEKFENDKYDEKAYSALELSYNHLKSNSIKQLFLLCGLLINTDYAIEDLLIYCTSLDSVEDIDHWEDRRLKLHQLVIDLRSSCLLLDGDKKGYIKMHDVVRKFAVSFAREKHNMFIGDYDGELEEWPKKNAVAKYSTICFPHNYIHKLPERLECKELKLFILHSKNCDLEIPSSFFEGLRGIIVLDIKNIKIPSLPSSLRHLEKLRTLSLEGCELEDISMIGNLVGLEVLRIVNTNLSHLPEEIRRLTGLKLFIVSGCSNLKVIPPNVISSLTQLEVLSMKKSFVNWEAEGVHCQNACLAELNKLFKLTRLDIHIPNSHIIMPNDSFSVKLERFKILIGDDWDWDWGWSSKYETSRRLKLKLSTSIHLKHGVKKLLKKIDDLYLDEVGGVSSVCELDTEGFQRLKCLHVQKGCNFQSIVNSNKRVPCHIFPDLEVLSLVRLINLEMICQGQLGVESFSKLRILEVEGCGMLKNLFSFSIAKSLLQLQEISVEKCENMEEIISCESEEDGKCDMIELSQVHLLSLGDSPKITSFSSEVKIVQQNLQTTDSSGSSQNMQLKTKDEPIPFLNGKIVFPNLEKLSLDSIRAEKIWDNSLLAMPRCFETLRDLRVSCCDKLKFLFPVSVIKSLIQLEELRVNSCVLIEGIIEGVAGQMIFPKLHLLYLVSLPKLKIFCTGNSIEFPSLSDMTILQCPDLKLFIFDEKEVSNDDLPPPLFDEKIVFPNLDELSLYSIGAEKIWDNSLLAMPRCFETLRELQVSSCKKLKFLFPVSVIKSLIQLEELQVNSCDLIEGIIEGGAGQMIFPKLRLLYLRSLPKLKRFCTGNSIEFPSLSDMHIMECPDLESFIFDEKEVSNDDLPPPLFDEKVTLPNIERLVIESIRQLKRIWHNEIAPESFCRLDELQLDRCENLLNIFPSNMLTRLQNLRELKIENCESMDVIFDLEGQNALEIHIPIFRKLESIRINGCPSLRYIFPLSIFSGLQELDRLHIKNCEVVENIVATEEVVDADVKFEFPKVTSLDLVDLPKLRSFYPGIHTSKWPLLQTLKVVGCGKLEIFASESSNIQEGAHDEYLSETSVEQRQSHFLLEKETFPNPEELSFTGNYTMKKEGLGEFGSEFCRLKSLMVDDIHYEIISFHPGFFKKLPNLETLVVMRTGFNEIFPNGGVIGEAGDLSTFCSLKTLRVLECDRLKILFPSSLLSFCNLIELRIRQCNGLNYLMSCWTAKSMMHLKILEVYDCEMMTSFVECVGEGEGGDDIIFSKLKTLTISNLPNLSSFCGSRKHAFELPSLEEVYVGSCPNLKTFCEGPLSTSKPQSLFINYEERWDGNLNTTIQNFYKETFQMPVRIQSQFRRHVARRDFIALRKASIVIQSAVRGNNARKFFESLKGDIASLEG